MTLGTLVEQAAAAGVRLAINPAGTLKAKGDRKTVNRWLPIIRQHKAELIEHLSDDNRSASIDSVTVTCRRDPYGTKQQAQVSRPTTSVHGRAAESAASSQAGAHANPDNALTDPVGCVGDPARLRRLIETACRGLSIRPEQLWGELEKGGDLSDVALGALTENGLRLGAETLAVVRYPYAPPPHRREVGETVHGTRVMVESTPL